MIESFRHKGLKRFFEDGDARGINPQHAGRIEDILGVLHIARTIDDIDVANFRLHPLQGDLKGIWAVTVRANWRIIFRFEPERVNDVDLVDYH